MQGIELRLEASVVLTKKLIIQTESSLLIDTQQSSPDLGF